MMSFDKTTLVNVIKLPFVIQNKKMKIYGNFVHIVAQMSFVCYLQTTKLNWFFFLTPPRIL